MASVSWVTLLDLESNLLGSALSACKTRKVGAASPIGKDQKLYMKYYNEVRTHLSLEKDAPVPRAIGTVGHIFFAVLSWAGCITNISGFDLRQAQPRAVGAVGDILCRPVLGRLHHQYVRI